jgi:hypothetical protein
MHDVLQWKALGPQVRDGEREAEKSREDAKKGVEGDGIAEEEKRHRGK